MKTGVLIIATLTLAFVAALMLAACDEPNANDKPTKDQAVAWVETKAGLRHGDDGGATDADAKLLWYVPYRPTQDAEAHGTTNEPARSFVFYERSGICFLYDITTSQRFLAPCDTPMPKKAVKP